MRSYDALALQRFQLDIKTSQMMQRLREMTPEERAAFATQVSDAMRAASLSVAQLADGLRAIGAAGTTTARVFADLPKPRGFNLT